MVQDNYQPGRQEGMSRPVLTPLRRTHQPVCATCTHRREGPERERRSRRFRSAFSQSARLMPTVEMYLFIFKHLRDVVPFYAVTASDYVTVKAGIYIVVERQLLAAGRASDRGSDGARVSGCFCLSYRWVIPEVIHCHHPLPGEGSHRCCRRRESFLI